MILPYALLFFFACIAVSLVLNLWRLLTAPTVTDRILTLDTMTVNSLALVVAYGIWAGTGLYLEVAVLFARLCRHRRLLQIPPQGEHHRMTTLLDLLLSVILIGGGLFALVGSYGLLRLPRPMQRLHAPTKATTIGVGAALLVSALDLAGQGQISWQEGLITLFLLLTAPVAALFLAKTLILRGEADPNLPDPGTGTPWATLAEERPDP